MSFPPNIGLLMANSLSGMNAANPAVNPQDDMYSRFAEQQAQQLEAPHAPPATAGPIPQFMALLGAQSGANLLRQPGAADGAERAVQIDMAKPEEYRKEGMTRQDEARVLRLTAMKRAADQAADQAEREGDFKKKLALLEKGHEYDMELAGINNAAKAHVADTAAASRENVAGIKAAASAKKGSGTGGMTKAEAAALYRSELAHLDGQVTASGNNSGWTKEEIAAGKARMKAFAAQRFNDRLTGKTVTEYKDMQFGGTPAARTAAPGATAAPAANGKYAPNDAQIESMVARAPDKATALKQIASVRSAYDAATYRKIIAAINRRFK